MTLYETLTTGYDVRVLLQARGVELDSQDKTSAPSRDERTPSVQIYPDHWYDYGDPDKHGDFVDWLEQAEGMTKEQAYREAALIVGYTEDVTSDQQMSPSHVTTPRVRTASPTKLSQTENAPSPWVPDLVTQAHAALKRQESDEARLAHAYFKKRGVASLIDALRLGVVDETVKVLQAGGKLNSLRGRAIIPTLEQGQPVSFKARYISADSDAELKAQGIAKYDGSSGTLSAPFNSVGLEHAAREKFLVVTEGEFDAMSLLVTYSYAYPVLGFSGGIPRG